MSKKNMKVIYLAAPLFSQAEKDFNRSVEARICAFTDVFLPQRDGSLLVDVVERGEAPINAARKIFNTDTAAIRGCKIVIAILDGRSVDEGVCFELGYAHALGKECVGLQLDPRRLLPSGNNPMIDGCLSEVFESIEELEKWLSVRYAK